MTPFHVVLQPYLRPANVHELPPGLDKWEAVRWVGRKACAAAGVRRAEPVVEALLARERILTTGIGYGCAVPHARHPDVPQEAVVVARAGTPLDFHSVDGLPVRAVFCLLMPPGMQRRYIEVLGAIASALRSPSLREEVYAARTPGEFVGRLLGPAAVAAAAG